MVQERPFWQVRLINHTILVHEAPFSYDESLAKDGTISPLDLKLMPQQYEDSKPFFTNPITAQPN